MACDQALYWLSARGSVSDSTLRNLSKRLYPDETSSGPYWAVTHSLQVLGHAEWNQDTQQWTPLPPYCLELAPDAFLWCGARLPGWVTALKDSAGLEMEEQFRQKGPQRWLTEEPPATQGTLDIRVVSERGVELLKALPDLDTAISDLPMIVPPAGGKWERLTPAGDWIVTPGLVLPDGLYRNLDHRHDDYVLIAGPKIQRARSREEKALVWWWQQGQQRRLVFGYDSAKRLLLLPHLKGGRLPLVIERALCGSSGLLPHPYHRRHWAYINIDRSRAEEMARILLCKLEVS
jgi:hypothetical protein